MCALCVTSLWRRCQQVLAFRVVDRLAVLRVAQLFGPYELSNAMCHPLAKLEGHRVKASKAGEGGSVVRSTFGDARPTPPR